MTEQPTEKMVLTVVGTERRTSKQGRTYLSIGTQAQGNLSCFDEKLWPLIPSSGVVAVEIKRSGNDGSFRNIVGVNANQQLPTMPPPAPTTSADPRNWSITRQTALKAAVDAMGEMPPGGAIHDYCDAVMKTADIFHAWLLSQGTWDETF